MDAPPGNAREPRGTAEFVSNNKQLPTKAPARFELVQRPCARRRAHRVSCQDRTHPQASQLASLDARCAPPLVEHSGDEAAWRRVGIGGGLAVELPFCRDEGVVAFQDVVFESALLRLRTVPYDAAAALAFAAMIWWFFHIENNPHQPHQSGFLWLCVAPIALAGLGLWRRVRGRRVAPPLFAEIAFALDTWQHKRRRIDELSYENAIADHLKTLGFDVAQGWRLAARQISSCDRKDASARMTGAT